MYMNLKEKSLTREASQPQRSGEEIPDELKNLADQVYTYLDEKKAEDILLLDLYNVNPYFQFFLIATANSPTHLKSLVRELRKRFGHHMPDKQSGLRPTDVESGWVILDFIDLVVHIFLPEQREFYNLERLWGDARKLRQGEASS